MDPCGEPALVQKYQFYLKMSLIRTVAASVNYLAQGRSLLTKKSFHHFLNILFSLSGLVSALINCLFSERKYVNKRNRTFHFAFNQFRVHGATQNQQRETQNTATSSRSLIPTHELITNGYALIGTYCHHSVMSL